jgi:hypothetical protein
MARPPDANSDASREGDPGHHAEQSQRLFFFGTAHTVRRPGCDALAPSRELIAGINGVSSGSAVKII